MLSRLLCTQPRKTDSRRVGPHCPAAWARHPYGVQQVSQHSSLWSDSRRVWGHTAQPLASGARRGAQQVRRHLPPRSGSRRVGEWIQVKVMVESKTDRRAHRPAAGAWRQRARQYFPLRSDSRRVGSWG